MSKFMLEKEEKIGKVGKKRVFADRTRKRILDSAKVLFAKKGYSGTSMQSIADKAKVNQALLYHHFDNKEMLWKFVKQHVLDQLEMDIQFNTHSGLSVLLDQIIAKRFELYQNSIAVRLMLWQQLEPGAEGILSSTSATSPERWVPLFKELQEKDEIRKDLDLLLVSQWLAASISAIVLSRPIFKNIAKQKVIYKSMLVEAFTSILSPDVDA